MWQDDEKGEIADYTTDVTRATALFNLPFSPDSRVLSFGTGRGTLGSAICGFVKEVVAMDITYPSLAISSLVSPSNMVHVHGGEEGFLPFMNETFDLVILNGSLEWLPRWVQGGSPTAVQHQFLKEVKRILKKEGEVPVGMENRWSATLFAGQRERHSSLRFAPLMPRAIADLYERIFTGTPYRTYTYSRYGLIRLLRLAGFKNFQVYWPWWIYDSPRHVFPENQSVYFDPNMLSHIVSVQRKMSNILLHFFMKWRWARFFVPSFYIRAADRPLKVGFADSLIRLLGDGTDTNRGLFLGQSLIVFGRKEMFKVGISPRAEKDIRQDYYWGEFAGTFESLRRFIPDRQMINANGCQFLITPKMDPVRKLTASVTDIVETFLSALSNFPKNVRSFREVLEYIAISPILDLTGVREDWETILEILGDTPLLLGAVHGDFHLRQLFWFSGKLKVIDWSLFSLEGIYGIDHFSLAMHYWLGKKRLSWWELFHRRILTSDRYLRALFPNEGYMVSKLSLQSKIAFAIQKINNDVSVADHPIRKSYQQVRMRVELIRRLRRYVESMDIKDLKRVSREVVP